MKKKREGRAPRPSAARAERRTPGGPKSAAPSPDPRTPVSRVQETIEIARVMYIHHMVVESEESVDGGGDAGCAGFQVGR